MAWKGNFVYAERRRDNEDIHRSPSIGSATVKPSDGVKSEENRQHETIQEETEKLLACPCLDDLKRGPCGDTFKDAFRCFILSKKPEKGAECRQEFTTLELCMVQHKEMFKPTEDRVIPKQELSIPPVPASGLIFHEDIDQWSKETDKKKKTKKKKEEG